MNIVLIRTKGWLAVAKSTTVKSCHGLRD